MSADLVWMCTRKNSSFLRMKKGTGTGKGQKGTPLFSAEPNNLMSLHSYKYSGLANTNVIGVEEREEGGCVLSVKSGKANSGAKPASAFRDIELTKDFKRVAKTIGSISKGKRPDLVKSALTRWYKINKAQKNAGKKTSE